MRVLLPVEQAILVLIPFVELLNHGHEVIIIDDLSNSKKEVLNESKRLRIKYLPFIKDKCKMNLS